MNIVESKIRKYFPDVSCLVFWHKLDDLTGRWLLKPQRVPPPPPSLDHRLPIHAVLGLAKDCKIKERSLLSFWALSCQLLSCWAAQLSVAQLLGSSAVSCSAAGLLSCQLLSCWAAQLSVAQLLGCSAVSCSAAGLLSCQLLSCWAAQLSVAQLLGCSAAEEADESAFIVICWVQNVSSGSISSIPKKIYSHISKKNAVLLWNNVQMPSNSAATNNAAALVSFECKRKCQRGRSNSVLSWKLLGFRDILSIIE